MADSTNGSPKKKKAKLPHCPYGSKCYRKNPAHFKEFSHPEKEDSTDTEDELKEDLKRKKKTPDKPAEKQDKKDEKELEPCPYGAKCYRKNLIHFAEFSHPTKSENESGSDTDICDSGGEGTSNGATNKPVAMAKGGGSLVKRYSKMSEEERKELIRAAMEAKAKLEKELEKTKDEVARKQKELEKARDKVNSGVLLMEGEKEALEGSIIKYYTLIAERSYQEDSAAQAHFRLAESQFYRLMSGQAAGYRVTKVEYVVNPALSAKFKKTQSRIAKLRDAACAAPVLAFHGTADANIKPIVENGFLTPGSKGFKAKTDSGYYGNGTYFSEYPGYSMGYIAGNTRLLLSKVIQGKVHKCKGLEMGAKLRDGYDSHTSPCGKELVIFDSTAILPCYIVYYETAAKEFVYKKETKLSEVDGDLQTLFTKADKKKGKKNLFAGLSFAIHGYLTETHAKVGDLIRRYGGTVKGKAFVDVLVTTEKGAQETYTDKVARAMKNGTNIVREDWVYQSIIKGKSLDVDDYLLNS